MLSVFATFFVPYIYSIPSFSICLVSFGLVLLSYTSNFLITCNRLFLGLFIKPAPILISLYIVHFFTDSLQLTASISFLIPLVSFFFVLRWLKLKLFLPQFRFLYLFSRKSLMSLLFSFSQSASSNILVFAPNTFAIVPSHMNLYSKLLSSSAIILRLLFIRAPRSFAVRPLVTVCLGSLALSLAISSVFNSFLTFVSLINYAFTLSILNLSKIHLVDKGLFFLVILDQFLITLLFLVLGVSPFSLFAASILNVLLMLRLLFR